VSAVSAHADRAVAGQRIADELALIPDITRASLRGRILMPTVSFPCPVCRTRGVGVVLRAVMDDGPLPIVVDVIGDCSHAHTFCQVEGQTIEETWTLITAALGADCQRQGAIKGPSADRG
jgi:hypothetical protein